MCNSINADSCGCADDSSSGSQQNSTGGAAQGITCSETNGYQTSVYGSVIKGCLPGDFPLILADEVVYYKVSKNSAGQKVLNIGFANVLSGLRNELKSTYESYYGSLTNIGTVYDIWSGCNENSSIKYESMHAGISVEFIFGAECVDNNPNGAVNTQNRQNNLTWEETLASLLPADYPAPVTHLSKSLPITVYYVYAITQEQVEQVISILKQWYNQNPQDTFVEEGNSVAKTITAKHVSLTEPHTLTISYIAITQKITMIYNFE